MFTLFHNAKIYTLNKKNPDCSALMIQGNRIVFCGSENDFNLPDSKIQKINLSGYSILPSFIDCHTHFSMASKKLDQIALDSCQTFDETIQEIKNNIHRFKKGEWVKGGGWNANLWEGFLPDKNHLDEISVEHPIALFNKDLHTMWLNSSALKICGFESEIPSSLTDKIVLDTSGKPTGIIYEDACHIVEEISRKNSVRNDEQNLLRFSNELLKNGITSVHTMEDLNDLELFMKLHSENKLKTRICFHPPSEEVDTIIGAKIYSGFGNAWLRFGGLKYYVDGSMGSQTAEMFENFEGLNHAGIEMLSQAELTEKVKYAAEKGLSATIHAIGDKANHKTLNAIEVVNNQIKSPTSLRHRIEHSQILMETDIPRFHKLNVIASMQPSHIAIDVKFTNKYLGQRAKNAFPINSLIKSGTKVVFGSDLPVADFSPFKGLQAAISRRYDFDPNEASWFPTEIITIQDAVHAYTTDAAYASHEENIKGTLEAGKLADFVILSDDILNSKNPEETLKNVEVVATVLDGEIAYRNKNYNL